jgi:hypothetical protein
MRDDYQYQPQPLPPKNEGLFGYGGKPNEGSRGFQGQIVDYGGTPGGDGGGGSEGPQGPQGPQGPEGPEGPQGPEGPGINLPSGSGVLGIKDGKLFVYDTIVCEEGEEGEE